MTSKVVRAQLGLRAWRNQLAARVHGEDGIDMIWGIAIAVVALIALVFLGPKILQWFSDAGTKGDQVTKLSVS